MSLADDVADAIEEQHYSNVNVEVSDYRDERSQHVTVDARLGSDIFQAIYEETGAIVSAAMEKDGKIRLWFAEPSFETREVTVEKESVVFHDDL